MSLSRNQSIVALLAIVVATVPLMWGGLINHDAGLVLFSFSAGGALGLCK
jgi:hypothetical protein